MAQKSKLEAQADRLLKKAGTAKKEKNSTAGSLDAKYDYKRRALKQALVKSGKWAEEMSEQLTLTARTGAICSKIWAELSQEEKMIVKETSREGNDRVKVNPLLGIYLTVEAAHRKNLRALKLNKEKEANDPPVTPEDENDPLSKLMSDD